MPNSSVGYAPPLPAANAFPGAQPQTGGPYVSSGTPSAGVTCVQTVTIGGTPTGGSFTLTFAGQTTGSIAWTATDATLAANITAALVALSNVGGGGVTTAVGTGSSGIGTYIVTFANQNANLTVPALTIGMNSLVGTAPTVAVAMTTVGVTATLRGAAPGTTIYDYVGQKEYRNTGTAVAPTWTRTGANIATIPLTATTSTGGGAVASWAPAEGGAAWITRTIVYTTTKSTGAATMNVGVAANATTSANNLLTAADIGTATIAYDNIVNASTSGKSGLLLPAGSFVTASGSADSTGLVGNLYVEYVKL